MLNGVIEIKANELKKLDDMKTFEIVLNQRNDISNTINELTLDNIKFNRCS